MIADCIMPQNIPSKPPTEENCQDLLDLLSLLKSVVDINSYTFNKAGTDRVGEILGKRFRELGLKEETVPREKVGDIHIFYNEPSRRYREYRNSKKEPGKTTQEPGGDFVFLSHLDTVFPPEEKPVPFSMEGDLLHGNGVSDDKGGAVIIYQALRWLRKQNLLDKIPVRVVLNTDEEEGSFYSADLIRKESAGARCVIVAEYGKPLKGGATVVVERLGRGKFHLEMEGKYSETALLEIIENSYYIAVPEGKRFIRIKEYYKKPYSASCDIYFGFADMPDGEKMKEILAKLIEYTIKKFSLSSKVSSTLHRPPLIFSPRNREVFERIRRIGSELDFLIRDEHRTACSDASFVDEGVPVLDGMGPIGDNVHTQDEFMRMDSLTLRPRIIADFLTSMSGD